MTNSKRELSTDPVYFEGRKSDGSLQSNYLPLIGINQNSSYHFKRD